MEEIFEVRPPPRVRAGHGSAKSSHLPFLTVQHVNVPVEFERFDISGDTSQDAALFKQSMDSLKRNKVGLKGAIH